MSALPRSRTVSATACALALALTAGCAEEAAQQALPPPDVIVADVVQRDVPIYMELVGQTIGSIDVTIRARVDGFLEARHFVEGTFVDKGQLLYEIDPRPLEAQVVAAEGNLAGAKTRLTQAESDLKRIRPLAEMNAVSQRDLDAAVANEEAARAAVQAAEAELDYANIQLGYSKIYAPMDGLIGITEAKVGDYVGKFPNPVVLNTLSQIDPIHVRFSINEREYLRLARRAAELSEEGLEPGGGQERTPIELILADGTIHPHQGYVDVADSIINPETGTLTLEANFPNPRNILRPGQFARVRGAIEIRHDALLVPQRSVQELQGKFRVYVVADDDTVEVRDIQVGPRVDDSWIIDLGVNAGERVIVEGLQRVGAGMTVVPSYASTDPEEAGTVGP